MAFKPNYNQQRNERNRAKEQKKQEKLQRREEEVAKRKAAREERDRYETMPAPRTVEAGIARHWRRQHGPEKAGARQRASCSSISSTRTARGLRTARCRAAELGGLEGDEPARIFIEAQDRKISEMSGKSRAPIKSISRSPGQ